MNLLTLVLALAAAFGQAQPLWKDAYPSQPMTCRWGTTMKGRWDCRISAEEVDVPAIQVGSHLGQDCGVNLVCFEHQIIDYSCADKSRILLKDVGGTWHCLKFGGNQ